MDAPESQAHDGTRRPSASRAVYLGLFLVTLSTLAYQVLLTRIFSVTMWYHFAFLAVSIGMFGVTAGAIAVYLAPGRFASVHGSLAWSGLLCAGSIAASLAIHLALPPGSDASLAGIASLVGTCVAVAVPFTASGICVALALTRFPGQISRLYAADLAGAALGCVGVVGLLALLDAPTAVLAVAAVAALGARAFASAAPQRIVRHAATAGLLLLVSLAGLHAMLAGQGEPWLGIRWTKGVGGYERAPRALHERWNSHSRIRVWGDADEAGPPFGWTFSRRMPDGFRVRQLHLDIDSSAYTVLTGFDGALEDHEYLRYDITNLAHHLREDAKVLVIGAGGGRDVLSALLFDQAFVTAVEVNADILDVVHGRYGEFTGHLDEHPRTRFVNDEARSFVARSRDRYDVIQISLIDSWAATGAGAFVLTEHSLYTTEAWRGFLDHLEPGGLLTVTRYYFPEQPATAYRLVALAVRALEELGVRSPREHLALAVLAGGRGSMFTLIASPDPLSAKDSSRLDRLADEFDLQLLLSPSHADDEILSRISAGGDLSHLFDAFPLDISPPTDDRPFFFHMLRPRDVLDREAPKSQGLASFNLRAVRTLGVLFVTVGVLTLLCVLGPLMLRERLRSRREALPWLLLFGGIGLGFMMVEISQLERLIVFLGHPTYALSVVLFALLLASGLGSFATGRIRERELARAARRRMAILLGVLAVFGLATPAVMDAFRASATPVRIGVSAALLFPIGFVMGMPFPMGIKVADASPEARELTPWLWGINGATSVFGSVLAIVIALSAGISASLWTGFGAYCVAAAGLAWALRRKVRSA